MFLPFLLLATQDFTSTGRHITPTGVTVRTAGLPTNLEVSPDGKWVAVTHSGTEQDLVILSAKTGKVQSRVSFEGSRPDGKGKDGLYFGLKWAKTPSGESVIYASNGSSDRVDAWTIDGAGTLRGPAASFASPRPLIADQMPHMLAGVAISSDGKRVYAAGNQSFALSRFKGSLSIFDYGQSKPRKVLEMPAFPLDTALLSKGPGKDKKLYVSCEGASSVAVVDTESLKVVRQIPTGLNPTYMALDSSQRRLFVTSSSSDTVTVVDTATDQVLATILVRPAALRGLSGANPLGLSVSPDDKSLFVALSDLNAVAVIDLQTQELKGMVPTGWYPTDVVSVDGALMVATGKGIVPINPNLPPAGASRDEVINGNSGSEIRMNLHGGVSRINWPIKPSALKKLTAQVGKNNAFARLDRPVPPRPGIDKVIYIIKENRTYDQFFGDFKTGNGDPKLLLYGDAHIPNQRALARRFGLFDNFYACAEMSADGWGWATAGITSEYNQRNAQYEYSGHKREYDYEGQLNGSPADARGIKHPNDAPGGYLWDNALKAQVPFRNYGMFLAESVPIKIPGGKNIAERNDVTRKALAGFTNPDYLMYNLSYADSDLWEKLGRTFPKRLETYGAHGSKSRFTEWKREYDEMVAKDAVPSLMMVRFGNDHTEGTTPGFPDPGSMIADNDYAVGQLVEAVSHGPLWSRTAIVIVEDDAQGGYDHVDGHRSVCWVISPWCKRGATYHEFANTDSALHTVEWLLGLAPSNQFTATALPLNCFETKPTNLEPFTALMPDPAQIKVNSATAYRAADSARLFNPLREESAPDRELASILWRAAKGPMASLPVRSAGRRIR